MAMVKVVFEDPQGRQYDVIFGRDVLRTWQDRLREYCEEHPRTRIVTGFRSAAEWVLGMKHSSPENMQKLLDLEASASGADPRQYEGFVWEPMNILVLSKAAGRYTRS